MAKVHSSRIRELLQERRGLFAEISTLEGVIHGSIFERFSTCSRPQCSCHEGNRHGPRVYLSVNGHGRQRQHYVPKSQVQAAEEGVLQYRRLREIIDRITHINLELIRGKAFTEPNC